MDNINYKAAYERQKEARAIAEDLLESRSRELYDANKSLQYAYNKLKDQKQKIIHQEKLASLGQLSAGVAHEINNPAGYIKSNLTTLKTYSQELTGFLNELNTILTDGPKAAIVKAAEGNTNVATSANDIGLNECTLVLHKIESLCQQHDIEFLVNDITNIADESRQGITRIEEIVKGLRDFSRPDDADPEVFNIISCVENTLDLVKTQIRDQLKICCDFSEPLYVKGQKGSLSQVFLNFIVNATHAVGEDGHLTIKVNAEDTFAVLRFEDNGCGMTPEICNKIFEPFFTTKKNGAGTGLGLSISHGIIKTHGGLLSVESQPNVGTCFTVKLPLTEL